ncbi:MAG: ArdC family protein, partial [Candidatus Treponema excrementipullorum]|nr:ArdC family protein [Candidatus Treponema excrementipullorum]
MNQEKKIKYHEQNVEKLYEAVKTGTAPFLPNEKNSKAVNNVIILTPRPVVRSAASGKVFKGLNQLVAQVELDKMSRKDASVITYEQAQKLGSAIKKGEKSFTLTSYNKDAPAGTRLTVYHVFPTSAVASHSANLNEKLAHIKKLSERNKTSIVIECTDSKPEKFLGAYLA